MDPGLKSALRRQALAARAAMTGREAAEAAMNGHLAALLDRHPQAVVAGYWPMRGEADPRPALTRHKGPVCLPVVVAPATPLLFRQWRPGDPLQAGPLGTRHPPDSAMLLRPDVVIVPLAGFDDAGGRLGYGGGFYDRTIAVLRTQDPVLIVGFAFDVQRLNLIPVEATDAPLDWVVTESGLRRLAAA